ncbi:MAG TPA: hypothetical protein VGJ92_10080 [Methanocella sp.]
MLAIASVAIANGQGFPCIVRGQVLYNGDPAQGAVVVAAPGDSDTTNSTGYYGVTAASGSIVTITATYNGHQATITVNTPSGGRFVEGRNIAIVYVPPATPTPAPTPTPVPGSFHTTIAGVSVTVSGNTITAPSGTTLSSILTGGQATIPAGEGTITVDITARPGSNTGTITGIHIADSSTGTLNGAPATISASADLDDLPSGSVGFSASVSQPTQQQIDAANGWLAGRSRSISGTPLAVVEVDKNGITNADLVNGTAKFTLTMAKPAGFSPTKHYTVIRRSDTGYEELTATVKSTTATTVTFEIVSPHGFSVFLLVETAPADTTPTPLPTPATPPASPTKAPGIEFPLIALSLLFGALLVSRVSRK